MPVTITEVHRLYSEQEHARREPMSAAAKLGIVQNQIPKLILPATFDVQLRSVEQAMRRTMLPLTTKLDRYLAEVVAPIQAQMEHALRGYVTPLAIQAQRVFQEYAARIGEPLRAWARRVPYILAEHALEAALEEDRESLSRFARRHLRIRVTGEKIDAVIMALFEQTWMEVPSEEVMAHLRRRTHYWFRNGGKPLWEHQVQGVAIGSLQSPIGRGTLTVGDVVAQPEDPIQVLVDQLHSESMLGRVVARLSPKERRIFLRRAMEGSWSEAARAEGIPSKFGDNLRRKLSRWVDQGLITDPRVEKQPWTV